MPKPVQNLNPHSLPETGAGSRFGAAAGSRRGFTLLEFLVAMTILGLMAVAMLSSFRLAVNSYKSSQERLDQKARQRVLEDLIRRQVGSLFPLVPTGDFLSTQESQGEIIDPNTGAPAYAVSRSPLFFGTPESMTFVTVAPLLLLQNPGLTVVRYGLAEDEWGRRYFGEMETRYSGLDSFQQMVDIPRGKPYPMMPNVEKLFFEYYGFETEGQTYQWFDEWEGDRMLSVPAAVRITADDHEFVIAVNASFFGASQRGGLLRNLIR